MWSLLPTWAEMHTWREEKRAGSSFPLPNHASRYVIVYGIFWLLIWHECHTTRMSHKIWTRRNAERLQCFTLPISLILLQFFGPCHFGFQELKFSNFHSTTSLPVICTLRGRLLTFCTFSFALLAVDYEIYGFIFEIFSNQISCQNASKDPFELLDLM